MVSARVFLDLNQHHFRHEYGDITLFGGWIGKNRTPALILVPTALIGFPGVIPCIVPITSAWRYSEESGDPRWAAQVSQDFANNLGFGNHDMTRCIKVMSIIRENLGRLQFMPPKPAERAVVADVLRTDEYGREHHSEVSDDV